MVWHVLFYLQFQSACYLLFRSPIQTVANITGVLLNESSIYSELGIGRSWFLFVVVQNRLWQDCLLLFVNWKEYVHFWTDWRCYEFTVFNIRVSNSIFFLPNFLEKENRLTYWKIWSMAGELFQFFGVIFHIVLIKKKHNLHENLFVTSELEDRFLLTLACGTKPV